MNYYNLSDDICCICLEKNNETSKKLKCNCYNKFHLNCINNLKKYKFTKCPLCNKIINENNNNNINQYIDLFYKFLLFLAFLSFLLYTFFVFIIIFIFFYTN